MIISILIYTTRKKNHRKLGIEWNQLNQKSFYQKPFEAQYKMKMQDPFKITKNFMRMTVELGPYEQKASAQAAGP